LPACPRADFWPYLGRDILEVFTRSFNQSLSIGPIVSADAAKTCRPQDGQLWGWLATAKVGDPLPELVINPLHSGRLGPRAVKRRPNQYALLNQPRNLLTQRLFNQ